MRVDQIMKKNPECLRPTDTANIAAVKMRDFNVGFLPVCESGGKILGALTDRDLCVRVCADDKLASKAKVGDVMTREMITCRPDEDVSEAARRMGENHKSRIMVVDASQRLVGVISLSDIAGADSDIASRTMRDVSEREVHAP